MPSRAWDAVWNYPERRIDDWLRAQGAITDGEKTGWTPMGRFHDAQIDHEPATIKQFRSVLHLKPGTLSLRSLGGFSLAPRHLVVVFASGGFTAWPFWRVGGLRVTSPRTIELTIKAEPEVSIRWHGWFDDADKFIADLTARIAAQ